jgi:hypothetical protein
MPGIIEVKNELKIYTPTIYDLFWQLDSHEMADFFNLLGENPNLGVQMAYVAQEERLNGNGKNAMKIIGDCLND